MSIWRLLAASLIVLGASAALSAEPAPNRSELFTAVVRSSVDEWAKLSTFDRPSPLPPLKAVEPPWFNQEPPLREVASTDGMRVAGTDNGILYVRDRTSDTTTVIAGPSGTARWTIEDALWSPDGRYIAARRIDDSAVPRITLTGDQFGSSKSSTVPYSRVGEPIPVVRVAVLDTETGRAIDVPQDENRPYVNVVDWSADGRVLHLLAADRLQHSVELLAFDTQTGAITRLHREVQPVSVTSLNLLHGFSNRLRELALVSFLPDGSFIWLSDRSGYQHLYLHDRSGQQIASLTEGKMTGFIDRLLAIDVPRRQLFARATGFDPADPYGHKLVRIDLDTGKIAALLTSGQIPSVAFSPDYRRIRLIRTAFPETVEIVEISDEGGQPSVLYAADWSEVIAAGYRRPEIAYVPAADGKTPLRAAISLPTDFDPAKRYPVIHEIYGGQPTINVPLSPRNRKLALNGQLADAGFIVVVVDGRGTPGRGREFQNFDYGHFGEGQADDQIAALRGLAATRPYMDLSRVGVIGGSWGGYFGLRTALSAPEIYKAGVFYAGAFEMARMRVSAEPFMGCAITECPKAYAKASNIALLDRLRAPLLIMHGTADNDVPIGESENLIASLDRLSKPYDYIAIPGWNHFVSNWPQFLPRALAHFKRHLGEPAQAPVAIDR